MSVCGIGCVQCLDLEYAEYMQDGTNAPASVGQELGACVDEAEGSRGQPESAWEGGGVRRATVRVHAGQRTESAGMRMELC